MYRHKSLREIYPSTGLSSPLLSKHCAPVLTSQISLQSGSFVHLRKHSWGGRQPNVKVLFCFRSSFLLAYPWRQQNVPVLGLPSCVANSEEFLASEFRLAQPWLLRLMSDPVAGTSLSVLGSCTLALLFKLMMKITFFFLKRTPMQFCACNG